MRTLRLLFGLVSIVCSIVLALMFFVPAILIWVSGFVYLPLDPLNPQFISVSIPLIIAGFIAVSGRRNKIASIIAGIFYIIAGAGGIYFANLFTNALTQPFTTCCIILFFVAAFFILGGIFQNGMYIKSATEKRLAHQYEQSQMQAAVHPVIPTQIVQPVAPTPVVTTPVVTTPKVPTPVVTTPEAPTPEVVTPEVVTPEVVIPEVVTPEVVTPEVVTPEAVTPEAVTPEVVTPEVVTPEVVTPEVPTPEEPKPVV